MGILTIFDSAPESIKKQFQDLVVEILCFLGFLRELELSKFFLFVVLFVYFVIYVLCLSIVFRLFYRFLITVLIPFTSCVVCVLSMGPI